METVKFQCGHCQNLMAVGLDLLGQQVRCPSCQQVVIAPAPPTPAPLTGDAAVAGGPDFLSPPPSDQEDIFTPAGSDDLFGGAEGPRLDMPPTTPSPPNGAGPAPAPGPSFALAPLDLPPGVPPPGILPEPPAPVETFPHWMEPPAATETAPETPFAPAAAPEPIAGQEMGATAAPRRASRRSPGLFMPLVFVPLVFYAIGATFFVAWSIWKVQQITDHNPKDLFQQLPDDGDDAGVQKNGKKISFKVKYDERFSTTPLPEDHVLKLGETRRFGELEVTPLRVERKNVRVAVEGASSRPEPCRNDSLVLTLKLHNVSDDQAFAPLDNYFDRYWKPGTGPKPLTQLEAGEHRFCGGPAQWFPRNAQTVRENNRPQWVEGRKSADPEGLKPGAAAEGFVCTDGNDDEAAKVLIGEGKGKKAAPYPGPFLWRVQVRRGLIPWRDRERSATTVVGVSFRRSDIGGGEVAGGEIDP